MKISPLKAFRSLGFLTLFIPAVGYSEDSEPKKLVPLQEYLSSNSQYMSDPPTFRYVLVRCTSMYYSMSALFKGETAAERIQLQAQLQSKAEQYLNYSTNLEFKIQETEKSDKLARLRADIEALAKIYSANMHDASTRLGSLWKDETIKSDYDTCEASMKYFESVRAK